MAPSKRKKKPASNPARGFATVSVPSKTSNATSTEEADTSDYTQNAAETDTSNNKSSSRATIDPDVSSQKVEPNIQQMTPEQLEQHLEESELTVLLESNTNRCKTEAIRQITELESEHRLLRPQCQMMSVSAWLSDDVIDTIVATADAQSAVSLRSVVATSIQTDAKSEHNLILQLWTLKRVLEALKLPQSQLAVVNVIRLALNGQVRSSHDYIWGLQEAFDWYARNAKTIGLQNYGFVAEAPPKLSDAPHQRLEINDRSSQDAPRNKGRTTTLTIQPSIQTPQPLDASIKFSDEDESECEDNDDPELLVGRYVKLRSMLWKMERDRSSGQTDAKFVSKARRVESRLSHIQNDILFDRDKADSLWTSSLPNLAAEYFRKQRQIVATSQVSQIATNGAANQRSIQDSDEKGSAISKVDTPEDEGLFGDMFGAVTLDPDAEPSETTSPTLITQLDFGRWTGISPRKILEEACKQRDPNYRLSVQVLQKTPYSARHKITIRWTNLQSSDNCSVDALPTEVVPTIESHMWTLEMKGVVASDAVNSEAYISTLFLFLITSAAKSLFSNLILRLPTVWRELLNTLGKKRQELVSREDLRDLQELKSWIHNVQSETETSGKSDCIPENAPKHELRPTRRTNIFPKESSTKILELWQHRIITPSFQTMQTVRSRLPVHEHQEVILGVIAQNRVVIICAETGAGKSSGIPVLLLEQQLNIGRDTRIMVTQPRRISAVTLARRVSEELGERRDDVGTNRSLVGFAIRLESKTSSTTRITYATTGVLLRMLEDDPDLDGVDYLMLDEIHERTIDLDLIFIAVKRLQARQQRLKIILMSATVDARKMSAYFDNAPILDLPGRTFPVDTRFLEDAVEATVGLDGPFGGNGTMIDSDNEFSDMSTSSERSSTMNLEKYSAITRSIIAKYDEYKMDYELIAKLCLAIANKNEFKQYCKAILIFVPGIGEIQRAQAAITSIPFFGGRDWLFHQLHSSFSTEDLERAFQAPPPGCRKIVIATNIAETGITIPDITAVIDTCKEKVMRFDERRQMSKLNESFISRASARQRRGRAARVQPGLCFHLVSRHRHDNLMLEQQIPEMLRVGLQDSILRLKVWGFESVEETLQLAVDPPTVKNIARAIQKLKDAGALTKAEGLTDLGRQICRLPLDISLAKLVLYGVAFQCVDSILSIVAILTSKSLFLQQTRTRPAMPSHLNQQIQHDSRKIFARGESDILSSLNAYQAWRKAKTSGHAQDFCRRNHLSDTAMTQIEDQKVSLMVHITDARLITLNDVDRLALNKRRNATRRGLYEVPQSLERTPSDALLCSLIAMSTYPRILVREGKGWRNVYSNQTVKLTSKSVNHGGAKPPMWLSYYEAMQNKAGDTNVFETSVIPEIALAVMMGHADFRMFTGCIIVDHNRIRLGVSAWRHSLALRILRDEMDTVLQQFFRNPLAVPASTEFTKWIQIWLDVMSKKHPNPEL